MTDVVLVTAVAVALAAAARSTWSPCGRSMLSTLTPVGERGRGHRFGATAAWFVAGGILGGLCLGALGAGLAAAVAAAGPSSQVTTAVALGLLLVGTALDAELGGVALPIHRRQVNERWLDRYRNGIYGLGFGWQIGVGLATYIMTAGVYLVPLLGALTGRPWEALALGGLFGAVRGLAVLGGRSLRTPAALADFHRRLDALGRRSQRAMVAVEAAGAVAVAGVLWPSAAVAVAVAVAAVVGAVALRRRRVAPTTRPVAAPVAPVEWSPAPDPAG